MDLELHKKSLATDLPTIKYFYSVTFMILLYIVPFIIVYGRLKTTGLFSSILFMIQRSFVNRTIVYYDKVSEN